MAQMLPRHSRYDYSPLIKRKNYSWPEGKRLAFCMTTNIECFAFGKGRGMDPAKHGEPQNHRNYSWRDYGNRIGVWRLFELFDDLKLPVAHNTNSLLYDYAPEIFEAIRKRGDEIVSHGRTNAENLKDFAWEADEARVIAEVTETFRKHEDKAPKGWMGPGAAENSTTPDLLKEAGYQYIMDWPADDQPFWMRTRSGKLLAVPYPVELNDAQMAIHRAHTPREFCDMMVDQFEEMLRQSERHPLVMNISVHPFIFGQPYRLRPFRDALEHCVKHKQRSRIWFCQPGQVSDYCYELPFGTLPGDYK
ncbi:MAG TPA: polysaccharide deacetylase family protein [Woeseiaceae bacterium]|nr:polysaccharide deacetylase family protein [Woeseiaceae bacterium]